MYIEFIHKTFRLRKHSRTVLREELQTAKFCTEVSVILTHLMIKLNVIEASLYMVVLHAIVLSQQYCRITLIYMIKHSSFYTFT